MANPTSPTPTATSTTDAGISEVNIADKLKSVIAGFTALAPALETIKNALSSVGSKVSDLTGGLSASQAGITALTISMIDSNNSLMAYDSNAGKLNYTLKQQASELGNITGLSFIAETSLGKLISKYGAAADSALAFQKGMLSAAAESGNLSMFFDKQGKATTNLNDAAANYSLTLGEVAKQTNTMPEKTNAFAKALAEIPGGMTAIAGTAANAYPMLSKTIEVATAMGKDPATAIKTLKEAYDNFGKTGQEALEYMTRAQAMTDKLGVSQEYGTSFIKGMADQFKVLGDNTKSATDIAVNYFDVLKNNGLSAQTNLRLISNAIGSLSQANVANLGFLSGRTGGPGGLRGGIQLQKLMAEGKTDEVMDKVKQVLMQQFGGKIYSREDASKSEFAAAQYIRQGQMLQSGAFGGIAKTSQDADAWLDALSKGGGLPTLGGGAGVRLGEDTTARQQAIGKTIIDESRTPISQAIIELKSASANASFTAVAAIQEAMKPFQEVLKNIAANAGARAIENKPDSMGIKPGTAKNRYDAMATSMSESFVAISGVFGDPDKIRKSLEGVKSFLDEISKFDFSTDKEKHDSLKDTYEDISKKGTALPKSATRSSTSVPTVSTSRSSSTSVPTVSTSRSSSTSVPTVSTSRSSLPSVPTPSASSLTLPPTLSTTSAVSAKPTEPTTAVTALNPAVSPIPTTPLSSAATASAAAILSRRSAENVESRTTAATTEEHVHVSVQTICPTCSEKRMLEIAGQEAKRIAKEEKKQTPPYNQ